MSRTKKENEDLIKELYCKNKHLQNIMRCVTDNLNMETRDDCSKVTDIQYKLCILSNQPNHYNTQSYSKIL